MSNRAFIQTPTPDLEESLSFYTSLGFKRVSGLETVFVTDGKALIRINDDPLARAGVCLVAESPAKLIESCRTRAKVAPIKHGSMLIDPSGLKLFVAEDPELEVPGLSEPFGTLGNFMGLSQETVDLDFSLSFWEMFGYEPASGGADQGWIQLSASNGLDISLMGPESCPHLTPVPGLTYFNSGRNPEVIKKIRAADIRISEEITCFSKDGSVDNVILHDPGGLGFFVFND